ncbi:hypothetical protein [Microbacterium sp. 5K110]|uniref:hypothetical protein n=1 Tax=unclassified Microbacterium TaxID=2609290 RepID=UPI0010FE2A56|nr:hypothetical protein [Microbacterium sp. 5K110]TLF33966.1 hypothetical protein FE256_02305 [Microbacterium sp. 5K110]
MPTLVLDDGREVDVIKPNVQEKILAQSQYRREFKTSPADMVDVIQSVDWAVTISVFATLHRNGVPERMPDLLDDERIRYWHGRMRHGAGEIADAEAVADAKAEGEQSHNPSATEAAGGDPAAPTAPPSTD